MSMSRQVAAGAAEAKERAARDGIYVALQVIMGRAVLLPHWTGYGTLAANRRLPYRQQLLRARAWVRASVACLRQTSS